MNSDSRASTPINESHLPLEERLLKVETILKSKLYERWDSVRKAFLDIDEDYDGYITEVDFERLIRGACDVRDLKTLM